MIRFVFVLWCAAFSTSIFGQNIEADLRKSFNKFTVVKINNREAVRKAQSSIPFKIQINDKTFQFILKPNDIRSADYKAEFTDNDGRHSLPRSEVFTYQGTIIGESNSLIALTVDGTTTEGYIATESEGFFIESAKNYSSRAGDDDKVIYQVKDKIKREDNIHGLDESVTEEIKSVGSSFDFNTASSPQIGCRVLMVATEADKEFVQEEIIGNGDPAKANAHILSVMNQVDAVYQRDLNLRVVVTFQHAWVPGTTDPYAGFTDSVLISAFRLYWNANFPASNTTYRRDVAHLFTRKLNPYAGVAFDVGTVCNPERSYSFTSSLRFDKWTTVAHELGHNLGAHHTNEITPVPPNCSRTIMEGLGSGATTGFCPYSINEITTFVNTKGSCLDFDSTTTARATPLFDFDGDGKSDISVFRPSNGYWYISKSSGGFSFLQWGQDRDAPVPGDYDGDGKTDLAVYRVGVCSVIPGSPCAAADNYWYIFRSSDNTFLARPLGISNGSSYDAPVPADYDGDGKTDLAVYTQQDFIPAPGFFTVLQSSTNTRVVTQWGYNSDKLVPADYDGDGRADLAVFRRESGAWYILQSSNAAIRIERFGLESDRIVTGDYDGDGRADLAVWRPSTGYWYWINSSDKSFNSYQFGLPDDLPVPADYDGDGKTDVAVFRPSTGVWYLLRSRDGFAAQQFGLSRDIPIPNVFVRY
jgi:Metallo-peptidase family M12/Reprolysin family propeptide/FG-GAP-like repeat